jgi:hypothetical protein
MISGCFANRIPLLTALRRLRTHVDAHRASGCPWQNQPTNFKKTKQKDARRCKKNVFFITCVLATRVAISGGGAGGVLRAFGADDDVDDDDDEDGDCERRSNTDGRGGKPGVVT